MIATLILIVAGVMLCNNKHWIFGVLTILIGLTYPEVHP